MNLTGKIIKNVIVKGVNMNKTRFLSRIKLYFRFTRELNKFCKFPTDENYNKFKQTMNKLQNLE